MNNLRLKDIREMVKQGNAEDITWRTDLKKSDYECIGIAEGIYGMCGGLFRRVSDNQLCAITNRTSNLWILC